MTWGLPSPTGPQLPPRGWYPDPSGQGALRWWDGTAWTQHVAQAPPQPPPQPPSAPARRHAQIDTQAGSFELAGWWWRLAGYVIDGIIVGVPLFVIGVIVGVTDLATQSSVSGTTLSAGAGPKVVAVGISIVAEVGYPLLLFRFRSQTVGMMAVGVRAVDATTGAAMSVAQSWARVLTFFGLGGLWIQLAAVITYVDSTQTRPAAASVLRIIGLIGFVTTAIWAAASARKQTVQDMAANTVVIRTRA
jgi:uncharacterized RDD family membrane protein YckC